MERITGLLKIQVLYHAAVIHSHTHPYTFIFEYTAGAQDGDENQMLCIQVDVS